MKIIDYISAIMRKIALLFAMVFMATALSAVTPKVLGNRHAMVGVDVVGKYLMLPVQESVDNASVRVLVAGEQRQSFNVRLAVDKIDYFVPLDISRFGSDKLMLDITFRGNKLTPDVIRQFVCWSEMPQGNGFETANKERLRPVYHHTGSGLRVHRP